MKNTLKQEIKSNEPHEETLFPDMVTLEDFEKIYRSLEPFGLIMLSAYYEDRNEKYWGEAEHYGEAFQFYAHKEDDFVILDRLVNVSFVD